LYFNRNFYGSQLIFRIFYDNIFMEIKFADRLKELRKEKKLTQSKLAKLINVSEDCIYFWEKGRSEPSILDLINLANVFEVSIDYLVGKIEI